MTAAAAGPYARLVLATGNARKLTELARILAEEHADVSLASLAEFPGAPDVAETGATFADNARLKARAIAEFTRLPTVADDSGLSVDALGGMPGVLSARWSGRHGDDEANLQLVLAQLADVPDARLGARFVCAAALVVPGGSEQVAEGVVTGHLIRAPRGSNGFGYDPIFVPDGYDITTAEMDPADKDKISHRGRALRGLAPVIRRYVS
jgi:XTP/dITP diphosphohydrolase